MYQMLAPGWQESNPCAPDAWASWALPPLVVVENGSSPKPKIFSLYYLAEVLYKIGLVISWRSRMNGVYRYGSLLRTLSKIIYCVLCT